MDVMQAIIERRSIRKYRAEPISEEALNTILEAARWAPSWGNSQCWRFIIVRDPETKSKLAETLRTRRPDGKNPAKDGVQEAPVVIVACAERELAGYYKSDDRKREPVTEKGEWWLMFDLALAMQNITLAAHALGLGTVHIGFFDTDEVSKILGIPDNIVVVELMPLGWPDEQPAARPRKGINEFVFFEKYPG